MPIGAAGRIRQSGLRAHGHPARARHDTLGLAIVEGNDLASIASGSRVAPSAGASADAQRSGGPACLRATAPAGWLDDDVSEVVVATWAARPQTGHDCAHCEWNE